MCWFVLFSFVRGEGEEASWPWSYGSWVYNCLWPLMLWVRISIRVRCTILCDKVCQWLATGRWFSQGPPVSSSNKTDRHNITEILLKVALNTIKQTNILARWYKSFNSSSSVNNDFGILSARSQLPISSSPNESNSSINVRVPEEIDSPVSVHMVCNDFDNDSENDLPFNNCSR